MIVQVAALGVNQLVPAVAGKSIVVDSFILSAVTANNVKFRGAGADLTGLIYLPALGNVVAPYDIEGWFRTPVGEALNLNLSAATAVGGTLKYHLE